MCEKGDVRYNAPNKVSDSFKFRLPALAARLPGLDLDFANVTTVTTESRPSRDERDDRDDRVTAPAAIAARRSLRLSPAPPGRAIRSEPGTSNDCHSAAGEL